MQQCLQAPPTYLPVVSLRCGPLDAGSAAAPGSFGWVRRRPPRPPPCRDLRIAAATKECAARVPAGEDGKTRAQEQQSTKLAPHLFVGLPCMHLGGGDAKLLMHR